MTLKPLQPPGIVGEGSDQGQCQIRNAASIIGPVIQSPSLGLGLDHIIGQASRSLGLGLGLDRTTFMFLASGQRKS